MPMLPPIIQLLKKHKKIDQSNNGTTETLPANVIIKILNSPEYIKICPKVSKETILNSIQFVNRRSTFANIKLIQTALTLNSHSKLLNSDEIRHGINAYDLICLESKTDVMEMNFDKI